MFAATWAVHLPAIKQATGISATLLGTLLLISGAGALLSMLFSSALRRRFTIWRLSLAAVAMLATFIVIPLAATTFVVAAVGAALFGVALGCTDVFLNAAAVSVEKAYQRPIMASFHGLYSVGNIVGSLGSAATFAAGVPTWTTAVGAAALGLVVTAGIWRVCPHALIVSTPATSSPPRRNGQPSRGRMVVLGVVAFLLFFCEGSALDWSSLHAQQHLGTSASVGTLAFAAIVATMTVGRFTVDRIAHRFGAVRVLRFGTLLATVGLVTVMLSPSRAGDHRRLGCPGTWPLRWCPPSVFRRRQHRHGGAIPGARRGMRLRSGPCRARILRLVRRRDIAEHRAGLAAVRTSRVRLPGVLRGTTAQPAAQSARLRRCLRCFRAGTGD